jgi:two-component system, sensor histidine kinase
MQANQLTLPISEHGFWELPPIEHPQPTAQLVKPSRTSSSLLCDRIDSLILTNRRKDEFVAMLSHELRSPLAAIQNAISVLRGPRGSDVTVQNGMHELIERQVRQMSLLATGLLDVGSMARGQLQLQHARIDLVTVLNNAVETVAPDFSGRSQILTATWPCSSVWVLADAGRLEQVFVNLLTNASKYTNADGQISLTLRAQDGYAVVRVKDSGIGIAAHKLPNIFDLFMQADVTAERSRSGVGVGLALVRKLVEMHDGTVTALSAGLGLGSEFIVRLRTQI